MNGTKQNGTNDDLIGVRSISSMKNCLQGYFFPSAFLHNFQQAFLDVDTISISKHFLTQFSPLNGKGGTYSLYRNFPI